MISGVAVAVVGVLVVLLLIHYVVPFISPTAPGNSSRMIFPNDTKFVLDGCAVGFWFDSTSPQIVSGIIGATTVTAVYIAGSNVVETIPCPPSAEALTPTPILWVNANGSAKIYAAVPIGAWSIAFLGNGTITLPQGLTLIPSS